ncbi:peptidoglycan-binding protein [Streptomyces sp. ME18-1-4]|uniref:peptidoglycan-binding protein n=1 Tax=Streptomyces sp. ME18-1-4 TaxID=3028685 RepID=UPI0029BD79C7|nr:peptidoglycan-binding protein [Streptomyces sp. ME18-1-4]MDX3243669.1 peptidoglycan-binding protein [Streptomyces sp. ME18-1-4]
MAIPDWKRLIDHVMAVPEKIYEGWNSVDGWDNHTIFGVQYGWDGVAWCAIFNWDMYSDCGLAAIVPKTASVDGMTAWAKKKGQFSQYPSVGAEVNFSNGAHTEIVIGFDGTNVYTKGGNSIRAGSVDNGQGNGVWSHATPRRATKIVGYFAPRFPDGICPPTADPDDPRGGAAVTSYTWGAPDIPSTPAPTIARYQTTVNGLTYGYGAHGDHVTKVGRALVGKGFGSHYTSGPGPDWSDADTLNYSDFQQSLGYTGTLPHEDADGVPGPTTLKQLLGSLPGTAAPALVAPAFPGRDKFVLGAHNDYALQLQQWLAKGNWGPAYTVGPSRTMTAVDLDKVKALQRHYVADLGPADGKCGPKTWLYAWQVANGLRKK